MSCFGQTKAPERTAKPVSAKPQPPVNKPTKVETVEAKSTVSAKPTGSKQQVVDGIAKSSDAKISEAENKSKTTAKAESVLTKSKEETKPTVKVQPVKAASKASTSANSSVSSESVNGTRRISVQKVAKPANSSTRSVSKSSEVRKSFNKKVDSVSKAEDGKIADKMVKPIVEEYIHIATNTVQGAIENAVVKISQSRRSSERSEATDKVENEKESESLVPNTSKYDKSQNKSQSKLMHNDKIEEPNETESVNISLKRESKSEEDKEDEDGEDIYGDIDFNNDLEEEADKMIAKLGTSTSDGVIEEIEE